MRYLPKSPADRKAMLDAIGARSIDDLFSPIPVEYRLNRDLKVPRQMAESEIVEWFQQRSKENGSEYTSFLGAGAYMHYRPVLIYSLISRGEFLTAYTPYQAEISQGTLQAIFEFQTMICELTGMEVANASMYDGSTGAAEAMLMAVRITGRKAAVVARSVHPEYREVMHTYTQHQGLPISECGFLENGRVDMADLEKKITSNTAWVLIQSPNFFGTIEDVAAVADLVHKKGALLVVSIAEALSLGIVKPPVEADIVSMESQSFGVPLGFGGPYAGVMATKEKFVRQMPGRLVGETRDRDGKRGFVLTLSTREQHIRREKATSNICTNSGLCTLAFSIHLALLGEAGLQRLPRINHWNAVKLATMLSEIKGVEVLNKSFFNEFTIRLPVDAPPVVERMFHKHRVLGGLAPRVLEWNEPELRNLIIVASTEVNTDEDRAAFVKALKEVLA